MSRLTTDANDPDLRHGIDTEPVAQAEVYLVKDLTNAEFVRPVRRTYLHVGPAGPRYPMRDLTPEEHERYDRFGYVKYEEYPPVEDGVLGTFWTQERLDAKGGCGVATTMSEELARTYAADPGFYGGTYCVGCRKHLPVGEFTWDGDGQRVGS